MQKKCASRIRWHAEDTLRGLGQGVRCPHRAACCFHLASGVNSKGRERAVTPRPNRLSTTSLHFPSEAVSIFICLKCRDTTASTV
ncbi:hypothetical protein ACLOJK_012985 [Asimina triloba]